MVKLTDVIYNTFRSKYLVLITILGIVVFTYFSYYGYNNYFKNKYFENMEILDVANSGRNEEVVIMFFHADWCPHCRKAQPIWDEFVSKYSSNKINGYKVVFQDVDCTNDKNTQTQTKLEKYNVESFPTIKMVKDNDVIDFDSKITATTLEAFVDGVLTK